MFKKSLIFLLNIVVFVLAIYFTFSINSSKLLLIYKILFIVLDFALFLLYYVFSFLNKKILARLSFVSFLILSIGLIIYYIFSKLSILEIFSSVSGLKDFILSTGSRGILIYILIQASQVVILPIPAAVICIAGSLIYGPLLGGIYCSIGVLIGSFISFFLGRTCGHKLVSWIVGEDNCNKYSSIILKRGTFFLGLAFLLPMFPDDILCLIAGITNMSPLSFAWVTTLTRPIGVICMSYFGSGHLIPFTGWGVYAWIVILILAVIAVYVTYRYQDNMQDFILNKIFKKKPKDRGKSSSKISKN